MFSYQFYKLAHFLGIFFVLMSLGGVAFAAILGDVSKHPWRKFAAMFHGIGLFLILLGGFGMLARLGLVTGLPGWIYGKLAIWVVLGGALVLARRRKQFAQAVWLAAGFVSLAAGYLALYKPF